MYNRYLSGEYIPEEPPQTIDMPSQTQEATVESYKPEKPSSGGDLTGFLAGFLRNFKFDTDDLLLLAILWLLIKDSGDDDILLIVAALFFMGFGGND